MTTTAGAIAVQVEATTVAFETSMDRAGAAAERSYQRQQKAQAAAQRDNDKFIQSIQRQVDSFGLTGTALTRYEASLRGVSAQAAPLIDRLERMKDAQAAFNVQASSSASSNMAKGLKEASDASEKAAHGTAGLTRELLVLGHEASQGNWKRFGGSLLVLGEILSSTAGGLGALLGPIVAIGVPILGFAAAVAIGASESKKLRDSLQLTGNAAGVTAGQVTAMSQQIAASTGRGIGAARTAIEELVKTGTVGPSLIAPMGTAVVQLEKLTGESSETIVKDFAKMSDGVAKWAAEHNKQFNFISGDQYAYIKRLEEQGQKEQAEAETLRILNDRLKDLRPNLGYLEAAWKGVGEWASKAWDAMKGVGRDETVEDRLNFATERVNGLRKALEQEAAGGKFGVQTPGRVSRLQNLFAGARDDEAVAAGDVRMERRGAMLQAQTAELNKQRIAAIDLRDHWRDETKGISLVNKELEKYRTLTVAPLKGTDNAISAQEQAATEAAIRKKYDPAGSRAGVKLENAFKTELESLTAEGLKLDAEIKSWELYGRGVDKARLSVLNLKIEQGKLQGLSPQQIAQLRSVAAADDAKDKLLAETETRVRATAAADKFVQKLAEEANAHATNARQQDLATRMAEFDRIGVQKNTAAYALYIDAIEKAVEAKHDQLLINKLAAEQLSVDDEVHKLDEEVRLLGMSTLARQVATAQLKLYNQAQADIVANPGKEAEILEALAKKNDELAAAITRRYNAERTADVGMQRFLQKYQEEASDAAKTTEQLASQATKTLEDSLTSLLSGQKVNFHSMVDAMIQEIIRLTIVKPLLADIFGGLTGGKGGGSLGLSGGSSGGLLGLVGGLFGMGGGGAASGGASAVADIGAAWYAQGTNYVPQDGLAYLHKGEAVVPASVNAGGSSGGRSATYHVHVNATQGMSRETAMQQGRDIAAGLRMADSRNG